jgi:hypothetical protein
LVHVQKNIDASLAEKMITRFLLFCMCTLDSRNSQTSGHTQNQILKYKQGKEKMKALIIYDKNGIIHSTAIIPEKPQIENKILINIGARPVLSPGMDSLEIDILESSTIASVLAMPWSHVVDIEKLCVVNIDNPINFGSQQKSK